MVSVLHQKFLVQLRYFHYFAATVFSLVNQGIVWVYFNKENTLEVSLEGCSLVKSARYLIVISFQRGGPHPNRTVFNLTILHDHASYLVTHSADQCYTGWFKNIFRVFIFSHRLNLTLCLRIITNDSCIVVHGGTSYTTADFLSSFILVVKAGFILLLDCPFIFEKA